MPAHIHLAILCALGLMLPACAHQAPSRPATTPETLGREWIEAWDSHDVDRILTYYTEDAVYEDVPTVENGWGPAARGHRMIRESLVDTFEEMPDLGLEFVSASAAGDRMVVEWVMTGSRYLEFTGRFSIRGVSIIRLEGDKIASVSDYYDAYLLLSQLGMVADATPRTAAAQSPPAERDAVEPELLWHRASALFPLVVHLPEDFDSTRTYPAVIALHGFGGSSDRFGRVGRALADAGFVAVLPEGPYPVPHFYDDSARHSTWQLSTWNDQLGLGPPLTDDLAVEEESTEIVAVNFIPSVIQRVRQTYRIGSLYMFGFSLGGVFALGAGISNHDQVDGIVAFGVGGMERSWFTHDGGRLEDGNHIPIRLVQGRSDPLVPFAEAEREQALLQEAGYQVVLDSFPGGHTVAEGPLLRAVTWLQQLDRP